MREFVKRAVDKDGRPTGHFVEKPVLSMKESIFMALYENTPCISELPEELLSDLQQLRYAMPLLAQVFEEASTLYAYKGRFGFLPAHDRLCLINVELYGPFRVNPLELSDRIDFFSQAATQELNDRKAFAFYRKGVEDGVIEPIKPPAFILR